MAQRQVLLWTALDLSGACCRPITIAIARNASFKVSDALCVSTGKTDEVYDPIVFANAVHSS
jgi:hypothetical protein